MPRLILLVATMLGLIACSKSQEFKAYEAFLSGINEDYSRAPSAYKGLSDRNKVAIYLGASELHPPDTRIADLAFDENFAFIWALRAEVEKRDDYVVTFDYVNEVGQLARAGKISSSELAKLGLEDLCRSLTSQSHECLGMLNAP
jgi:hypothetical protein